MLVTEYLSRIMPSVAGCPSPIAEMALIDSVDELCRESRILRETQSIPVVSGTSDYEMLPDTSGASVVEVLFSRIEDKDPLEPITPDVLNRIPAMSGEPAYIEQVSTELIRLHPTPQTNGSLAVTLVLSVATNASAIPASLDRWRDGIVGGALSRLMMMPNQPWSNPQMAAGNRQSFNQAVAGATSFALLGSHKATLRVQPRP